MPVSSFSPAVAHTFVPSTIDVVDARGHRRRLCELCHGPANSPRHRSAAILSRQRFDTPRDRVRTRTRASRARDATPPPVPVDERPAPVARSGTAVDDVDRHPFSAGGPPRIGSDGRRYATTCSTCGLIASAARHRPYRYVTHKPPSGPVGATTPPTMPVPIGSPPRPMGPAPSPEPVTAAPWELRMLLVALDAALQVGDDALGWRLRYRLSDLRRTIYDDHPDLAPDYLRRANGSPAPAPPRVADEPRPIRSDDLLVRHAVPKGTRRQIRAMRSDRMRALAERAIESGWRALSDGNGHIRITPPDGSAPMTLSVTSGEDARGWLNARAAARRRGLNVEGL